MIAKPSHPSTNAIIASLPLDQRQRVLAGSTLLSLESGKVLADAEQPIDAVYFPITAVISVLSVTTAKTAVESAVVGYEGMAPLAVFHGVDRSAEQVIVQVPGDALHLTREAFHVVLGECPALRSMLHRYAQALFTFTAQTSACNRQHPVLQRCARWLATTHDRVEADHFHLTHLFLSQMLGIRRSSVTVAAEILRNAGAIDYTRGRIHVKDREGLLARTCECYAIIRSTYDRLLAGAQTASPLAGVQLSTDEQSLLQAGSPEGSDSAPAPEMSFGEFSGRLRDVRGRADALRAESERDDSRDSDGVRQEQLMEELGLALEQLGVAEEEMRVQMDALSEMRLALETQHAQWRARFDGLPDAFIETDQDDTIIEMNVAAERLIGRPRATVIGKPIVTLVPDTKRSSLRRIISTLRQGTRQAHWSGEIIAADRRPTVDINVASTCTRDSSTAPILGGRFLGARWLMRPEMQRGL